MVAYQADAPLPGFHFQQPLLLILTYADEQIAGLDELNLLLYFWDEGNGLWATDGITLVERDPVNNRLAVEIAHLTTFALFASTLTSAPTVTPEVPATPAQEQYFYLPYIQRTGFKTRSANAKPVGALIVLGAIVYRRRIEDTANKIGEE